MLVAIIAALTMLFAPVAHAEPDDTSKGKVWVDPRVEEAPYIYNMIANQLDPGDTIYVSVEYSGPAFVRANTTHLVVFARPQDLAISVYGGTDWPDQKAALSILARSEKEFDPINRVLRFIRDTHGWQAEHPRQA